jgi:Tol biopolymer transport system component
MNSARKHRTGNPLCLVTSVLLALSVLATVGRAGQLVTQPGPSFAPPVGAGGNSGMPIISADGRYVVFASTANNLTLGSGNTPILSRVLGSMNVFVRDRTNQTTTLVSVNAAGTGGGNGDSLPRGISTNGQYVLFESTASNLVANDINTANDVFVRDLVHGTTTLVSVNTNGFSGNLPSSSSVMTPDGRYVAFSSLATNLVPGDTNRITDIFVRDLVAGTTTLVSVGAVSGAAIFAPPSISDSPAISPDGRYVVYFSTASNLVSGVGGTGEVYVRDLVGGSNIWASTGARGPWFASSNFPNVVSCNYEISDNDSYVAYEATLSSGAILRYGLQTGLTDLIATNANVPFGAVNNSQNLHTLDMTPDGRFIAFVSNTGPALVTNTAVYLWDAQTGSNTLVSINTNGVPSPALIFDTPAVSSNGQFVAFLSSASDLTTNPVSSDYHLFIRDMINSNTTLLDADSKGYGFGVNSSAIPVMSADGSVMVFESRNLLSDRRHEFYDVFARSQLANVPELISVGNSLLPTQTPDGISGLGGFSVSSNGQYIAFYSDADDLVPNDTNGFRDIFVRDTVRGTNILVSVQTNGVSSGDGISTDPAISGDGRYVAFTSAADNLVTGDTNKALDVFVRDLQNQTTALVSLGMDGVDPGNGDSYSPAISANGRYVLFRSKANNLATGSAGSGTENLIFRDLQAGTNEAVATGAGPFALAMAPAMTPDLQYVAFIGTPPGKSSALYVWNSQSNLLVYTNTSGFGSSTLPEVAISANGQKLAYLANSPFGLYVADLVSNTVSTVVGSGTFSSHATFQFSADGRFLAYSYQPSTSTTGNVYLYDTQAGTSLQVNQSFSTLHGTNGNSDSPAISPDGRYVAYRSLASLIVPDDSSPADNMFIYDRVNNATILASVDLFGNSTANDNSLKPVFSADSQTLAFESWASDLATNDFNGGSDIFALNLATLPVTIAGGGGGTSNSPPLYAALIPPGVISSNLAVSWPLASGAAYQVEYKTNLTDPVWQVLTGSPAFIGDTGYINDTAPAASQRFYRIVLTPP